MNESEKIDVQFIGTIKDSGERTTYESGAVRDLKKGKGRFDLVPLDLLSEYFYLNREVTNLGDIFRDLYAYQINGNLVALFDALKKFREDAFADDETMFLEVAKHYEEGLEKYPANNWKLGIPEDSFIDSASRHLLKWYRGDKDEPHDRGFVWNVLGAIWTHKHKKS